MRCAYLAASLAFLSTTAYSQDVVQTTDGIFVCHGAHPRCSYPDQSTYPYYQFSGQHVGQMAGVSDLLPNGPPLIHYQTFVSELISERPDTNAVSLWADAQSQVNGGRVWGGFISARSDFASLPSGSGADSQLIGLEIDVLNAGLPGVYPNASKVGLQIVGFGNRNTNAIEILTQTASAAWQNVINIQPHTVAPDGAVIGMAPQDAGMGINFLGSRFADSAFLVSENQKITFRTAGTTDAAIWRDSINNGYLVLQSGTPGLRVVNSSNTANLLIVTDSGDLVTRFGTYSGLVNRVTNLEATTLAVATNNTANLAPPQAAGQNALAVGAGASASGNQTTAIGTASLASAANATAVGNGATSSGANSVALGAGSHDGGEANVVSVGTPAMTRRMTNVTAGLAGNDAVNVNQLGSAFASARAYADMRFDQFNFNLNEVQRNAEGSTASAMALAAIPQGVDRGGGMIGVGVGIWQGERAMAIGLSKTTDDGRLVFRAGATYNSRKQGGANAGMGIAF